GAGSGIGKSFAENFGKAKSKVVLNYRSDKHDDSLQESVNIVKQAGGDALLVQGDVSKEADVINLIKQTVEHFGT
ncbi:SDR family NAD(P)-dependent oxidoreductase, partial [Salmonella enterica]|uniref:SDR family NAD(P)-dependent oxidoreductase n=1 Tax=Salmonella enterica TaxID=28901 RepID=UPI0015C75CCA